MPASQVVYLLLDAKYVVLEYIKSLIKSRQNKLEKSDCEELMIFYDEIFCCSNKAVNLKHYWVETFRAIGNTIP